MEEKEFDYMNVIPLVDVMLVLLTIVLTTSTFIAAGVIPVELPKASKSQQETLKTQTIEIDRNGNLYLNSRPISLEGLKTGCTCSMSGHKHGGNDMHGSRHDKNCLCSLNRDNPILIRSDRDIALQVFVNVLDVVKNSGFKRVSLQTEERK
ncbi:MAG: biopolymer transporter ExbD [Thermodesulfovibrionales bacterium]|nr:biopolymer transporter ExbD [Thermodesulfovibrionales bacterium]